MGKKIAVYVKEPGKSPEIRCVPNTLKAFQKIVGGYIETVTVSSKSVVICNEEGRLLGLSPNCVFHSPYTTSFELFGTIVVAGYKDDNFCDVSEKVWSSDSTGRAYLLCGKGETWKTER